MSPLLALKTEQRKRRGKKVPTPGADTWAPPGSNEEMGRRSLKRMPRRRRAEPGPTFRSTASANPQVISKVRERLAGPQPGVRLLAPSLALEPAKGRASFRLIDFSPPSQLDRAAAQVKHLVANGNLSDEDLISTARTLRDAVKSELHSDPPMADVCLVMADALTFTSVAELPSGALDALREGLAALAKARGGQEDARCVFSRLMKEGWRVTPAYDESEFAAWAKSLGN